MLVHNPIAKGRKKTVSKLSRYLSLSDNSSSSIPRSDYAAAVWTLALHIVPHKVLAGTVLNWVIYYFDLGRSWCWTGNQPSSCAYYSEDRYWSTWRQYIRRTWEIWWTFSADTCWNWQCETWNREWRKEISRPPCNEFNRRYLGRATRWATMKARSCL